MRAVPKRDQILVGLDIGTTKICAIVSEVTDEGALNIIGVGSSPSRGLRKGVVVDIESTVESIKKAVEEAELMAAVQINSVYTGIAGSHVSAENCKGVVALKKAEVTREDIQRVIESARTLAVIPHERRILHVLPREFMVDGQEGVREPLGLSGHRLEVNVHVITGAVTAAQNIIKCVNRAGLDVVDMVLQPLASSEAVLSQEERDLGVVMVDLGGGTTDLAIFLDGSIRHSAVLPIGSTSMSARSSGGRAPVSYQRPCQPLTAMSTRPRNRAGIISSIAELIAAYSPPTPAPVKKRQTKNHIGFIEKAVSTVATRYSARVTMKSRFRPSWSVR